jgi:hypothetical protein
MRPSLSGALYFLHIPKTAGTSFIAMLHNHYHAETVCPAYLWHQLLRMPHTQRSTYRLYRGHFYAYLNRVIDQPLHVITFLRDPIERSLSHYHHIYREPGHYFHQRVHEQGSLLAFLRDPLTLPLITNFQTRALAAELDPVAIAATLPSQAIDALMLEQLLETIMPTTLSDNDLLQRAKMRLDKCLFVGLTEYFTKSVGHLGQLLQWQSMPHLQLNQSPARVQREDLDPQTFAALQEQTHLDAALYAYSLQRFEQIVTPSINTL